MKRYLILASIVTALALGLLLALNDNSRMQEDSSTRLTPRLLQVQDLAQLEQSAIGTYVADIEVSRARLHEYLREDREHAEVGDDYEGWERLFSVMGPRTLHLHPGGSFTLEIVSRSGADDRGKWRITNDRKIRIWPEVGSIVLRNGNSKLVLDFDGHDVIEWPRSNVPVRLVRQR